MQKLGYKTVHAIGKRENLAAKNGGKTDNPPYEGSIRDLTAGNQGFFGAVPASYKLRIMQKPKPFFHYRHIYDKPYFSLLCIYIYIIFIAIIV